MAPSAEAMSATFSTKRRKRGRKKMQGASLTSREMDVLRLLAQGRTYRQVAHELHVSAHTVQTHVKNVYAKLDVHSAREAIWRALQLRILGT
jgi:DNA-binding NarL/FixJ family response regulator